MYCDDTEHSIVSHFVLIAVLEFKTAVVRGGVKIEKDKVLPSIYKSEKNNSAKFLES